jgi:hypothetical protein
MPRRRILSSAFRTLLVPLAFCSSLFAALITADLNQGMFGHLDQAATNCPAQGCGPTAAVNSFLFLENSRPTLYNNRLIPAAAFNAPTTGEMSAVVDTLTGANYMNTNCLVCGTYWDYFIYGKQKYIDGVAPGTTIYAAQSMFGWAGVSGIAQPKPAYVQDNLANGPTIDFLFTELMAQEDIEILISFNAGGGHYVTVTGLTYDTTTRTGTLRYIDPNGGAARSATVSQTVAGGTINIAYSNGTANTIAGQITVAVGESPVPEPVAFILVGIGLTIIGVRRKISVRYLQ